MTFKAVLVPLHGSDQSCDENALSSALTFSNQMNCHLDALHVRRDPRAAAAFVGEGMTTAMIESVIELAEKDSQKRSETARTLFDTACEKESVAVEYDVADETSEKATARFVERSGNQEDFLPEYGRMFDLIVVCKKATQKASENDQIINSAILETGRPVLVISDKLPEKFATRVAVIWNGSVESSRAITHALPILKKAEAVSLICAEDDLNEDISPAEAIRYLNLHGVSAEKCLVQGGSGRTTADALRSAASKFNADFIVMGAYTQSRLRRLIFGAVTGEMLEKCDLPILLAH